MKEKSKYVLYAEQEFKACGWDIEDGTMQNLMCKQVCELLELFASHGHSGSSAPYAISLFEKLAKFKPLCPLTGKDDELVEIANMKFQNKRCSNVFKDDTGVYDINGKFFVYPNGASYSNKDSKVYISFPYTPKTEYIKVDDNGVPLIDVKK